MPMVLPYTPGQDEFLSGLLANWAVKRGRARSNELRVVPALDERKDRRRIRRPLTDDELSRLLAVAEARGRKAWYLAAVLAGLRKSDLQRLMWADIDFDAMVITIATGKARRLDHLPLHPELAEELQRLRDERQPGPRSRVFPTTVTDQTRLRYFLRAGIAREIVLLDHRGEPIMVGKRNPRPKTRIVTEDTEGRVIDLHALRTTLGTKLARAGVAPQIAQRIMRHGDYRTTMKHYTVLELTDMAAALAGLTVEDSGGAL
ncbi:MAG: tyrosine-type recombinase/integrase [Phycisphaerales bacterium JB039]